jgi:hypothetical protein
VQAFHLAIGPNALALGLKAEAALGLFIGADTDIPECSSHGRILRWWSGGYAGGPTVQGKGGHKGAGALASTLSEQIQAKGLGRRATFVQVGRRGLSPYVAFRKACKIKREEGFSCGMVSNWYDAARWRKLAPVFAH